MGRAKLNMELISKEKSRNITFKKRKEGLIRKMHEFTTLCDVNACMIIYGPKQEKGGVEPEIWPQNLDQVRRIIDIYKAKNKDSGNKTFGLSDFFHDRKRKIEDELTKLRKKNMEAKYPTWVEILNQMDEFHLREFAVSLSNKADYVKSRIEFLRRKKEGLDVNLMDFTQSKLSHHQSHSFLSPGMRGIELEAISSVKPEMHLPMHVPMHFPTIDHHQEMHSVNQNSMMMLLMNDHDHSFGSASTSGNNIQRASVKRQVFYESSSSVGGHGHGHGVGVLDPMICHNPRPLAHYYPPPYMMPAVAPPPQLTFTTRENHDGGQEDIVQYHMKNH